MDLQSFQNEQQNGLVALDKKVTIKFFKEKRTSRTYIYGLAGFFNDAKITEFVKSVKKAIGSSSMKNVKSVKKAIGSLSMKNPEKNPDEDSYGFQGDHRMKIPKLLVDAGIPEEKIVISNS